MRSCYRRLHEPNSGHICHMRCLHSLQGHVLVSGRWVLTVKVLIQLWDRCPGFFHPVPFISKSILDLQGASDRMQSCLSGWEGIPIVASVVRYEENRILFPAAPSSRITPVLRVSALSLPHSVPTVRLTHQCQTACQDSDGVLI